jgi:hypothetical protein
MKQKRTITIEFDRVKITATHSAKKTTWCEFCRTDADFLDQTEAIEVARLLQQQGLNINKKTLHINQENQAEALVCLNSILTGSNPAAK